MGITDKIQNKAEELKGQVKEELGKRQGDEQLQAEGQNDQDLAKVKDFGEAVKDKLR